MNLLMTLVLMASTTATTSSVTYDHQVDFSRYKTWSWHEGGTPAMSLVTDKAIRDAIEKRLGERGLSRVEANATLFVVYHAAHTNEIATATLKYPFPEAPSGVRYFQKGTLAIDLVDPATSRVVWRGEATGVLRYGPAEIAAQVAAAVDALLAQFPPSTR